MIDMLHDPAELPFKKRAARPEKDRSGEDVVVIRAELQGRGQYSGPGVYWSGPVSQVKKIKSRTALYVAGKVAATKGPFKHGLFSGEFIQRGQA